MNHDEEEPPLLKRLRESYARQAEQQAAETVPGGPITPLYWHPFYRGRPELIDWLNSSASGTLRVPLPRRVRFADYQDEAEAFEDLRAQERAELVLTKRQAAGLAPYIGEPFQYRWNTATDQYGRSIAGEAHIVYLYGFPLYDGGDGV